MKIKKTLILLQSLLVVFTLSACSGGNTSGNVNGGTNATNNTPNNETATQAPTNNATANNSQKETDTSGSNDQATPEMDFDLGGKSVKVVAWWDMTIPEDNPDNIQKKKNLAELEKKHNFKMEYVAIDFAEYQKKVTASLLSGEPIGDIVMASKSYTIPTLVKQDLLWPVDEYTKNAKVFDQKITNEAMLYNGRGYGFAGVAAGANGIFYNRTLMNKLGMKPLQEYVDEGNWTWDTFIQVAKEANKDTNNDGKLDSWGLAGGSLLEPALASNETGLTKGDKQNLDDPKTVESLKFISQIVTDKVARATEGGDWTEPGQFFRQGNTLMFYGGLYEKGGLSTDMKDADIGFLPFPKGPQASAYHTPEGNPAPFVIPKAVANPEQLVYILEKINDIESIYDYPDQGWYESMFTDVKDIDNIISAVDRYYLEHSSFPNLPYYPFADDLSAGNSVSTVVEKYKVPFQAAIDEVYKK
ncbi:MULTISPECIES: ABC transporter substrate-binding protein [unclassified Paenibacillus]|uniref:ABC transporter substrate-binding protein n=1 Tax=unclassified Paenibacillus TaxID=185978 RepID=UPI0007E44D4E|nr:extracellular solute-binding protein [Paenibacillus sp. AD87]OAX48530.1 hypothetical protein gpAD87_10180 [Paenibacillus sp. AD87]